MELKLSKEQVELVLKYAEWEKNLEPNHALICTAEEAKATSFTREDACADWLALYSEVERLTERLEHLNKLDEMCDTLRRQMNDKSNSRDDILTMITSFKLNYENWRKGEQIGGLDSKPIGTPRPL